MYLQTQTPLHPLACHCAVVTGCHTTPNLHMNRQLVHRALHSLLSTERCYSQSLACLERTFVLPGGLLADQLSTTMPIVGPIAVGLLATSSKGIRHHRASPRPFTAVPIAVERFHLASFGLALLTSERGQNSTDVHWADVADAGAFLVLPPAMRMPWNGLDAVTGHEELLCSRGVIAGDSVAP